ncbi:Dihydrolipoyllysine-residue acetyltransferase component of pyruvate dehydrogenase complex [Buchnera aphidicola (Cinara kochiana kochiana)]|uniref:Dihydrolipoamide acetyltransferase component of pyruvate dehydrogenase complex n=1 Tax=Buchnera aphidicola (Cinara kochiana kochiana) TaxID=2518976 RepID=A0A451D5G0_9GAMM|nr:2-oxo acid dehydrogenase subunit E2 [Buchnera aphidicola]VFP81056.1 Dihydrolipoyllysine-residue acetyltransferase component of pyruvate dehydrogenase complex [Buchnera aphidicola (Cinara kochiana kochiana)]
MKVEVCMPDVGVKSVEIIEILVKIGDKVKKEDSLISVESHKSVLEIPAPVSGIIKKICVKVGDKLSVNKLIMILKNIDKNKDFNKNNINNNYVSNLDQLNLQNPLDCKNNDIGIINDIYASPKVRRIARLLNINLLNVIGSGSKGRITCEDVKKYSTQVSNNLNLYDTQCSDLKNDDINHINDDQEFQLLTNIQRISGTRLLNNWKSIPHVTQFDETDITDLEDFRKLYNSRNLNNKNFRKISLLSFLVKSVVHTLLKYPRFNSILHASKNGIIVKKNINIGIAVDTKEGLLVPVLKNLKYKNIGEISYEICHIVQKAKNNQLNISDMSNGTFTISSLGGIGGTGFTPIINAPEACILGVSKATIKPIWNQKKFYPRLILPFSLSYDHRIIDGADGVRFTNFLSQLLSDVRTLLV